MANPKHVPYAERLRELIDEGQKVAQLEKPGAYGAFIQGADKAPVLSWLTKGRNIPEVAFSTQSPHLHHFDNLVPKSGLSDIAHAREIYNFVGVLTAALDDLENGYLTGQEFFIAGEVFDSVLEQAKY